jgi:hypothetical protein
MPTMEEIVTSPMDGVPLPATPRLAAGGGKGDADTGFGKGEGKGGGKDEALPVLRPRGCPGANPKQRPRRTSMLKGKGKAKGGSAAPSSPDIGPMLGNYTVEEMEEADAFFHGSGFHEVVPGKGKGKDDTVPPIWMNVHVYHWDMGDYYDDEDR